MRSKITDMFVQQPFLHLPDLFRSGEFQFIISVEFNHMVWYASLRSFAANLSSYESFSMTDSSLSMICHTLFLKAKAFRSLYSSQVMAGNLRHSYRARTQKQRPFGRDVLVPGDAERDNGGL